MFNIYGTGYQAGPRRVEPRYLVSTILIGDALKAGGIGCHLDCHIRFRNIVQDQRPAVPQPYQAAEPTATGRCMTSGRSNHVPTVIAVNPKLSSLRIRIRDPGSGAFLIPGSGIRNRFFPDPGSRISDTGSQTHNFESLVAIFWAKIL